MYEPSSTARIRGEGGGGEEEGGEKVIMITLAIVIGH